MLQPDRVFAFGIFIILMLVIPFRLHVLISHSNKLTYISMVDRDKQLIDEFMNEGKLSVYKYIVIKINFIKLNQMDSQFLADMIVFNQSLIGLQACLDFI